MSEVEIRFPKAHSRNQYRIMTFFRDSQATEMWVASGSKFGKSLAASVNIAAVSPVRQNTLWRWIAPIYQQSVIGMRYMQKLLPGRPHTESVLSPPSIRFPSAHSQIQFWHGQDPESLEGEATNGNVLDECSKMKEQVYDSTKTTTTVTRGKIMAISTPRGRNWFWRKCMEAKEEMERAKLEGRPPLKLFITASTLANPYVTKEAIEEAKRSLPARLFRQYILAEFVDDAEVFSGYQHCVEGLVQDHYGEAERWFDSDVDKMQVVVGADWAKTHDFTVFTAIDITLKPMRVVGYYRFQGLDYITCVKELMRFCSKFKQVDQVYHDKTGIGQVIHDLLDKSGLAFDGIVFTNDSKSNMVNKLMLGFQNRQLTIPRWATLTKELDSFEVQSTDLGKMKYSAPSGQHDDAVCSLMLAFAAAEQFGATEGFDVVTLDTIKDSELPSWYNQSDDDW